MGPRRLRLSPTIDPAGHPSSRPVSERRWSRRCPQTCGSGRTGIAAKGPAPRQAHPPARAEGSLRGVFRRGHARPETIAENSGNLVFIHTAWKLLSAPGVEMTADRLVVRPDDADQIERAVRCVRDPARQRLPVAVPRRPGPDDRAGAAASDPGGGARGRRPGHGRPRWDAIRPSMPRSRTSCRPCFNGRRRSASAARRPASTWNGFGFRDVDVIGCPSMFRWGDTIDVRRKVATLDAQSNVAITISPYRSAMEGSPWPPTIATRGSATSRCSFRRWAFCSTGAPLPRGHAGNRFCRSIPSHPFFREHRTRFYVDPWPWIEDLQGFDFSFGTRIHGTIAALLAGTPAVVLAHDSRTLELARYFDIPHRLLRDVPPDLDPADLYAEARLLGAPRRARAALRDVRPLPRPQRSRPRLRPRRGGGGLRAPDPGDGLPRQRPAVVARGRTNRRAAGRATAAAAGSTGRSHACGAVDHDRAMAGGAPEPRSSWRVGESAHGRAVAPEAAWTITDSMAKLRFSRPGPLPSHPPPGPQAARPPRAHARQGGGTAGWCGPRTGCGCRRASGEVTRVHEVVDGLGGPLHAAARRRISAGAGRAGSRVITISACPWPVRNVQAGSRPG